VTGQLETKRAVVTGAGSGIGRATAQLFAHEGARLVIADIDEAAGRKTAEVITTGGAETSFVRADVSQPADMQSLFAAAASLLGGLDTIVNIAGVLRAGDAVEMSDADWDLTIRVNLYSCLLSARYGVPLLCEAGGGTITTIGSVAGIIGVPGAAAYSAAKAAVVMLTKSLAKELAPHGIRANAVCPGWVDTSFNDPIVSVMGGREVQDAVVASDVPMRRQARPEEIAPMFVFLASDAASYVTGKAFVVDGGAT
jgi:dihydroanticapsin dehydrogenase